MTRHHSTEQHLEITPEMLEHYIIKGKRMQSLETQRLMKKGFSWLFTLSGRLFTRTGKDSGLATPRFSQ